MVTIVDYGMGNLGSVKNMLKKIGYPCVISMTKDDIIQADKLILPGVGSFDRAINNLKKLEYFDLIKSRVLMDEIPILGVCLGMQLLTKGSEEGKEPGFGLIDAYAHKFTFSPSSGLKSPHMGWNLAKINKKSLLFDSMNEQENRFYFVHSYAVQCENEEDILTTTNHGGRFVSAFEKGNIIGAQFHPEKSHKFGMGFLENFMKISK
ncbi:imidazole glycerol phosphate synthase subunit HisH [Pseudoalteromonas arabiensis]|uniref:imidazole glycerol phosphate synthase subunit HisH n=1 Tax=Pseudoalteromonas arabiensis TaxID=874454 RepID=UPI0007827312|nr:imidazole glycerol phosphate synthase subunit HisH [Pseudoalteromonas arabiensis]